MPLPPIPASTVNVAFVDKGMAERLVAEGDRSPADLVLTVDIARLIQVVNAGVTQPVDSAVLQANIPATFRDAGNQWFGLTSRARIVYASKDRVAAWRCDHLRRPCVRQMEGPDLHPFRDE